MVQTAVGFLHCPMTDWKTLCSELLEAAEDLTVLNDGSDARFDAVAERVRAELAQPVLPDEGELTDGELNAMWNCSGIADEYGNHTGNIFEFARAAIALDRTRRALAKSEPVGPSDIELLSMAGNAVGHEIAFGEYEPETECAVEAYGSELIDFARAVLARWGRPATQSAEELIQSYQAGRRDAEADAQQAAEAAEDGPIIGEVAELVAALRDPYIAPLLRERTRAAELLERQQPQPVPVAVLRIEHFRGNAAMENVQFELTADLPPGRYELAVLPLPS